MSEGDEPLTKVAKGDNNKKQPPKLPTRASARGTAAQLLVPGSSITYAPTSDGSINKTAPGSVKRKANAIDDTPAPVTVNFPPQSTTANTSSTADSSGAAVDVMFPPQSPQMLRAPAAVAGTTVHVNPCTLYYL